MNSPLPTNAEAWEKAEERAMQLLELNIDMGLPIGESKQTYIAMMTKKIYEREMTRLSEGKESIFHNPKVIPDKSVPIDEDSDNN